MFKSTILIERIDNLFMEQGGGNEVFPRSEFMRIISTNLDKPIEQVWRVSFQNNGVDFYSFAMPQKNLSIAQRLNDVSQLPIWAQERIAVLQICEVGETIDGVGQKVSEKVFYVIE